MYVYGNLRLLKSYQNGEQFNALQKFNPDLINDRFSYPGESVVFSNNTEAIDIDEQGLRSGLKTPPYFFLTENHLT